jgi:hypothetical protein
VLEAKHHIGKKDHTLIRAIFLLHSSHILDGGNDQNRPGLINLFRLQMDCHALTVYATRYMRLIIQTIETSPEDLNKNTQDLVFSDGQHILTDQVKLSHEFNQ